MIVYKKLPYFIPNNKEWAEDKATYSEMNEINIPSAKYHIEGLEIGK
jgi:hypothetical protein